MNRRLPGVILDYVEPESDGRAGWNSIATVPCDGGPIEPTPGYNAPSYPCTHGEHAQLYFVRRRLTPWGHFATFRINGTSEVLDNSLPHRVTRLPRDARPLSAVDTLAYWHGQHMSVTGLYYR